MKRFPYEQEDEKYSSLYRKGYPSGPVQRVMDWACSKIGNTSDLRIVDCGCGNGLLSRILSYKTYHGIDVSSYQIKKLRENFASDSVSFEHRSLTNLLDYPHDFDLSCSIDVLEHLPPHFVGVGIRAVTRLAPISILSVSCRSSRIFSAIGDNLHLTVQSKSWWKAQVSRMCVVDHILDCGDLIAFICRPRESIFEDSLAIVGNSASEVGSSSGSSIDGYKKVVRFNNFRLDEEFLIDYGSRTTHWATSFYSDIESRERNSLEGVYCPLPINNPEWKQRYTANPRAIEKAQPVQIVPINYFNHLSQKIMQPSTGIAFLYWVYRDRGFLDPQALFGFSFFCPGVSHHYFPSSSKRRHGGAFERNLYDSMLLGLIG